MKQPTALTCNITRERHPHGIAVMHKVVIQKELMEKKSHTKMKFKKKREITQKYKEGRKGPMKSCIAKIITAPLVILYIHVLDVIQIPHLVGKLSIAIVKRREHLIGIGHIREVTMARGVHTTAWM